MGNPRDNSRRRTMVGGPFARELLRESQNLENLPSFREKISGRGETVTVPTMQGTQEIDARRQPIGEEGGTSNTPVQTPVEAQQVERGVPVDNSIAFRNQQIRAGGTARINALVDMFGEDAFIIQHLLFRIPPLSIKIKKQNINYQWKSLRTKDTTIVPSGHGECYISAPLVFVGENQLKNQLAELIKVFKISPISFIENKFVRDMIIPDAPEDSMAVCLETLHMSAASGRPDAVNVNLTMKWFNYKPYSHHFWFRKDWVPLSRPIQQAERSGEGNTDGNRNAGSPEGSNIRDTIVDLSQIETPENLDVSLPPEARIPSIEQEGQPHDITIAPTEPVIYPWNSRAYMNHVANYSTITGRSHTFDRWNDSMTMRWNSYRRIPWPTGAFNVETEQQITEELDSQPSRRERQPNPPPVTGRNVVLFVGDSITVGYALRLNDDSNSPPQLREVNSQVWDVFSEHSDFDFYAIAKVGANSATLKSVLDTALNDTSFAETVAGVVIACGANDGAGLTGTLNTVGNINLMCRKATEAGAIAVVLPVWPISDPVQGDPDFGKTVNFADAAQATISERNDGLRELDLTLGPHVVFRNTHVEEISTDPNSWGGLWPTAFRQISGSSINVHPNRLGYSTIAGVVNDLLPWASFGGEAIEREQEQTSIEYTVVSVFDGDTMTLRGPEGEMRVRLNYIDAPEISQAPWGEQSRDYLETAAGDTVTISGSQRDSFGRTLAEVSNSAGTNLNLLMVEKGYAAVYTQYASTTDQSNYYSAESTARTSNLQIWSEGGLHQTPWEYRRTSNSGNGEW